MKITAKEPKKKTPRKITPSYLENAALYYLQRYASSAENLKTVLRRKTDRSCHFHKVTPDEFYPLIDTLVTRYITAGLIDDTVYARGKAASLRRQGKSSRIIEMKLTQKGLSRTHIEQALEDADQHHEDAELNAAITLARRKKIGCFRTKPYQDKIAETRKEMAAMARAGFSFDIAKRALEIDASADDFDD